MNAAAEKSVEEAEGRSSLYDLLSFIFLKEPDEEFLRSLKEMEGALEEAGVDPSKVTFDEIDEEVVENLEVEYCAIFVGPGKHFAPYGSVYMDEGYLHGESTAEVEEFYQEADLEAALARPEPADHIGLELGLLSKLTEWEAEAASEGNMKRVRELRQTQWEFIDKFLIGWGPDFCQTVESFTNEDFYEEFFGLAADFIEQDYNQLSET